MIVQGRYGIVAIYDIYCFMQLRTTCCEQSKYSKCDHITIGPALLLEAAMVDPLEGTKYKEGTRYKVECPGSNNWTNFMAMHCSVNRYRPKKC